MEMEVVAKIFIWQIVFKVFMLVAIVVAIIAVPLYRRRKRRKNGAPLVDEGYALAPMEIDRKFVKSWLRLTGIFLLCFILWTCIFKGP